MKFIIILVLVVMGSFVESKLNSSLKRTKATCGTFGALLGGLSGTTVSEKIGNVAFALGTDVTQSLVTSTCYSYGGDFNNTPGNLKGDCSCYASYVINGVDPTYLAEIATAFKVSSGPVSATLFQQYFAGLAKGTYKSTKWENIADLRLVKKGDILAWTVSASTPGNISGDSGHVMIVINGPDSSNSVFSSPGTGSPSVTSTSNYIYVSDTSNIRHYNESGPRSTKAACTQGSVNNYLNTGVGSGQVLFTTDSKGNAVSFQIGDGTIIVPGNEINAGRAI